MFLRKYGVGSGADIYLPLVKRGVVDFAVGADYTVAAGDVKISIDGGAAANIGTLPVAVAMGNTAYWKFVFSDAELTGKKMTITVADSATKAVEDQAFNIETFGHASALYPTDLSASILAVNATQISGDSTAADNAESFFDGTGYAGTGNVIPTVTTLTNAPSDPAGVTTLLTRASEARLAELDAANLPAGVDSILADTGTDGVVVAAASKTGYELNATGVTAVQSGLATSANQTTILNRLGAWTGSGLNTILGALRALVGKAAALTPTDLSTGTTFDNTTDSLEAIRDRGDAAWTTSGGVSGSNAVTFTVRDSVSLANLIDVAVVVYGADGTTVVDTKRTNGSGQAVFSLDSASYYYAIPPVAGYSSVSNTALTVDGVEAVTVGVVALSSASTAPGTRLVRVIVRDSAGALRSGVAVSARLLANPSTVDQAVLDRQTLTATSDASGVADLTCITEGQFTGGDGIYRFNVPGATQNFETTIPDGASMLYLEDLINA